MKEQCKHKRIKKNYPFGKKSTAKKFCKDCGEVIQNKHFERIRKEKMKQRRTIKNEK